MGPPEKKGCYVDKDQQTLMDMVPDNSCGRTWHMFVV